MRCRAASTGLSGTFAQGNAITAGGQTFAINYRNNQVALTFTSTPLTWTGAVSSSWSDGRNWSLGRAPRNGDDLVFPANATRLQSNDNIASLTSVNSVSFTGNTLPATNGYTVALTTGSALIVGAGGLTDDSSSAAPGGTLNQFNVPVTLTTPVVVEVANTTLQLTKISGSAGLDKQGPGTLLLRQLAGAEPYTGATTIEAGTLNIGNAQNGSTLPLSSAVTVGAGAILAGGGAASAAVHVLAGGTVVPGVPADVGPIALLAGSGLTLDAGSAYVVNGDADAGNHAEFLDSRGPVKLNGATLTVNNLPSLPANTVVTLLKTDNGGSLNPGDTFNNLPNNTVFTAGGRLVQIKYAYGANGGVTLSGVASATLTWTGLGGDGSWNTGANWDKLRAPINGDSLVFPAGARDLVNDDNVPGLTTIQSIQFTGFFLKGGYQLNGPAASLTIGAGGIVDNGSTTNSASVINIVNLNVALGSTQTWKINDANHPHVLLIDGNVDNGGFGLTFAGGGHVEIGGQISGTGGLTVNAGGNANLLALDLLEANHYTGGTTIVNGTVNVLADGDLGPGGSNDAGTIVGPNGTLAFSNVAYNTAENLSLSGTLENATGDSSFAGAITIPGTSSGRGNGLPVPVNATIDEFEAGTFTLNGPSLVNNGHANLFIQGSLDLNGGHTVVIDNAIHGSGGLLMEGSTVDLQAANTYQGSTFLDGLAEIDVGVNGAIPAGSAVIMSTVIMATGGVGANEIELAGFTDTIGSLAGTQSQAGLNTVDLGAGGSLTTGGNNTSTTFAGVIQGTGTLTKVGTGSFDLTGANTFTGSTTVRDGTLLVDGSTAAADPIAVSAGATLGGKGVIDGNVQLADTASISPGSPNPAANTGTLTVLGQTFFSDDPSHFVVQLRGTAPGQFDKLLGGVVNLTGAELDVTSVNPGLAGGSTFVIVQAGAAGLHGTFAGLGDNQVFTQNGDRFRIHYDVPRGQVILTFLAGPLVPPPVPRFSPWLADLLLFPGGLPLPKHR